MNGLVGGYIDGQVGKEMDGWMDGSVQIDSLVNGQVGSLVDG